ncbi:MAG TPA: sigma-54-dependent Fis family transcriptional regulator [Bacteroidota bacterium]|nr:sigma-54-dependent Fis family transcriptional regulator [Bacteroidota bacterium]
MSQPSEIRQRVQKLLGENMSKLSSGFMELSSELKSQNSSPEALKKVDRLFKMLMEFNRSISAELTGLMDDREGDDKRLASLAEEKRRLEVLYTSGISFSSETEMRALMEKAIETVVRELRAEAGFIVLVNHTGDAGEQESVFARNMNPDEHPEAREMSRTVISNTLSQAKAVQVADAAADDVLSKRQSVIRLGISAVLCVPLVAGVKVLGAVYLDRRADKNPFIESDLTFLLSFARQIVRGLEISIEISSLEKKLLDEASMKFDDLRKQFSCEDMIGSSKRLFDILKISSKISPTEAPVLILGENGTGKDLLARAIHRNSHRSAKPFVTINCGAIPADLLESELFGYESGAFTGATKPKPGKLEIANGGSVFFDELGELSVNLQAKLLRVLQTKEIERLGSVHPMRIDVRFIAATNRDIGGMIEAGTFREDLYYRLKVIELTMPGLGERKEDIKELAEFFIRKYAGNGSTQSLSREALDVLEQYSWPGNVRELENVIHRSVVLSKGTSLEVTDLPPELIEQSSQEPGVAMGKPLLEAETEFRRMYIIKTLREASSVADAARILGINRTHFYKLLAQLGIEY